MDRHLPVHDHELADRVVGRARSPGAEDQRRARGVPRRLPPRLSAGRQRLAAAAAQPPIGARGFAPQKTCVPIIPINVTITMLSTIDLAVAVPTPTGPPLAW